MAYSVSRACIADLEVLYSLLSDQVALPVAFPVPAIATVPQEEVRVPLKAIRDINFPERGQGFCTWREWMPYCPTRR